MGHREGDFIATVRLPNEMNQWSTSPGTKGIKLWGHGWAY